MKHERFKYFTDSFIHNLTKLTVFDRHYSRTTSLHHHYFHHHFPFYYFLFICSPFLLDVVSFFCRLSPPLYKKSCFFIFDQRKKSSSFLFCYWQTITSTLLPFYYPFVNLSKRNEKGRRSAFCFHRAVRCCCSWSGGSVGGRC